MSDADVAGPSAVQTPGPAGTPHRAKRRFDRLYGIAFVGILALGFLAVFCLDCRLVVFVPAVVWSQRQYQQCTEAVGNIAPGWSATALREHAEAHRLTDLRHQIGTAQEAGAPAVLVVTCSRMDSVYLGRDQHTGEVMGLRIRESTHTVDVHIDAAGQVTSVSAGLDRQSDGW
jgi:hypothetical protein